MINLFNLKNQLIGYAAGAIAIMLAIFHIRKGGSDAQKLKTTERTNKAIIETQARINEAGDISGDDVLDRLHEGEF